MFVTQSASMTGHVRSAIVVSIASVWLSGCASNSTPRMQEVSQQLPPQYYDWFDGGTPVEMSAFDWNHVEFARQAFQAGNPERAIGILQSMADQGYPPGYYELGKAYEDGIGVSPQPSRAAELYGYAIQRPSSVLDNASLRLARLYREGRGVQQDLTLAYFLLRQAVEESGGATGKLELAEMVALGQGTSADPKEAEALYLSAAEEGEYQGYYALAEAYSRGGWLQNDPAKAEEYAQRYADALQPLAQAGSSAAMIKLARLHEQDGMLGPKPDIAKHWWLQAARTGNTDAQREAGEILLSEGKRQEGQKLLHEAAEAGDIGAMYHLGQLYAAPNHSTFDPNQAEHWFKRGAEHGSASAAAALGRIYIRGDILRKNPSQGVRYLKMAVARGHRSAEVDLGEALLNGNGVAQDTERGTTLLRRAAQRGNTSAQRILGHAYLEGDVLPQDSSQASQYLSRAANHGDDYAAQLLGEAYLTGDTIEHDPQEAEKWLTQASDAGRLSAQATLGRALLRGEYGMRQDPARGRELLLGAAVKGHVGAQATLGRELIRGEHIPQDIDQGVEYLVNAAQKGHPTARLALAKAYLWANGLENASQQQALLWLDKVIESDSEMALKTMRQLLTGQDTETFTIL